MKRIRNSFSAMIAVVVTLVSVIMAEPNVPLLAEPNVPLLEELEPTPLKLLLHSKNYEGGQTYFQGQPIGIQVGLIDKRFHGKAHLKEDKKVKQKIQGLTVGSKKWPWFRGLSMRVLRIEDTNSISPKIEDANVNAGRIADANSTPRTVPVLKNLNWPKRMTTPSPGAHVKNDVMYSALVSVFTLEPQISQSLRPGRYILQASWDSTKAPAAKIDIWRGRLEAKAIEITVIAVQTKADKGRLAFGKATYYIRKKDFDLALSQALRVEEFFPSYQLYRCYTIAGRAYQAKGDIRSAIKYYKKFLDVHKNANVNRWIYVRRIRERVAALEAQLKNPPKTGKDRR